MQLSSLEVRGVRNISQLPLVFAPGVNWLVGANGAGKSSVLEAISLLTTSRSFRGAEVGPIVQFGQSQLIVSGRVRGVDGEVVQLGVARHRNGETIVKCDGVLLRRASDLARLVPTYVFDAGVIQRLYQGSAGRRALLDWGVFHVEPEFGEAARAWKHVLAQRNAALRGQHTDQLDFWDREASVHGERIERLRQAYFTAWEAQASRLAARFGLSQVQLAYRQGWSRDEALFDVLQRSRLSDLLSGRTSHGPHRSDVRLSGEVGPARETLSRGQQKALAAALVLGQLFVRAEAVGRRPIALIDDLVAELDSQRAATVIALLREHGVQTFCAVIDLPTELVDPRDDVVVRLANGRLESA